MSNISGYLEEFSDCSPEITRQKLDSNKGNLTEDSYASCSNNHENVGEKEDIFEDDENPEDPMPRKKSYTVRSKKGVRESEDILRNFHLGKNIKEKLIVCLDLAEEVMYRRLPYEIGDITAFHLAKRCIDLLVHNKHIISEKHEFALAILQEQAMFATDFTSNPQHIHNELNEIIITMPCNEFEMNSLFQIIEEKLTLPDNDDLDPPYVIRVVLIYGRSSGLPIFSGDKLEQKYKNSKYFFLDVLYIHDDPSDLNNCQEIFELFTEFDVRFKNYVFEVSNDTRKFHNCMARFAANPLQRAPQHEISSSASGCDLDELLSKLN